MMFRTLCASLVALLLACQTAPAQDPFCPADTTGDLVVNVNDLLTVINSWGPCPAGSPCYADANGDAIVNVNDLLTVINGWGPCSPYFELEGTLDSGEAPAARHAAEAQSRADSGIDSWLYCTYRVDSSNPGSALVAGTILCTSCPLNNFNACPNLVNATFKGVPGAPAAMSTGVNATSIGNGFCQPCAAAAGGRKYVRTG